MSSATTTSRYDNLFSSTALGDDEIKQETSFLSEKDRGVKGSSELMKNYIRATKGTPTKFITLKALASNSITTDTEEDGVIFTSDIAIMFQQCAQASKQLQEIATQFDLRKAVEIPFFADSSKPATNGRWANKTTNILENPTTLPLDHVRAYTKDMIRNTPPGSTERQTQYWLLDTVRNSVEANLKT